MVLLALDALDAGLVEYFDIDTYRLHTHDKIETYSNMNPGPYTLEVWPTVATGVHATEHGVTATNVSQWENPLLELASKFTGHLSGSIRSRLGHIVRGTLDTDYAIGETEMETIFDGRDRVVHNWPGVHNSEELREVWRMTNQGYSKEEFDREVLGKCAEQFGWTREMLNHDVHLVGVHVHALDVFGHAHATELDELERLYRRVAEFVEDLRAALGEDDDLLILSDHGILNEALDEGTDRDFGDHSFRAFVSSTREDPLPESVFDVKDWVEDRLTETGTEHSELDMPEEQLRQLGYIE